MLRDEFRVPDPAIWHAKFYLYWLQKGGRNKANYQENWCHYWRVVLFHAPRRWLTKEKLLWGTAEPLGIIWWYAVILGIALFLLGPALDIALIALGTATATIGAMTGLELLARTIKRWIQNRFSGVTNTVGTALAVVFGLWLLGVLGFGIFSATIRWPLWTGIGAATILFVVGLVVAAIRVKEWWLDRRFYRSLQPTSYTKRKKENPIRNATLSNVVGTIQFAGQFVVARKRKICPPVVFDFDLEPFLEEE